MLMRCTGCTENNSALSKFLTYFPFLRTPPCGFLFFIFVFRLSSDNTQHQPTRVSQIARNAGCGRADMWIFPLFCGGNYTLVCHAHSGKPLLLVTGQLEMGLFSKDIATGLFPTSQDHPPLPACLFFDTDWSMISFNSSYIPPLQIS